MKEYVQPETRIKRVKDKDGERFYSQYKVVLIPYLIWWWENIEVWIGKGEYLLDLDDAKLRIDTYLLRHKANWRGTQLEAQKKKVKKEVEYIKYP